MSSLHTDLGKIYNRFIADLIASGDYGSEAEVIRAGLALLQREENDRRELIVALIEGEESGIAEDFDFKAFLARKHAQHSKTNV